MIIRFHNLGKIQETELDLRPMTVIIGPNNSNKTYIAYSVYGLLQAEYHRLGGFERSPNHDVYGEESLSVKLDSAFLSILQIESDRISTVFAHQLSTYYQDSSGELFSKTKIQVELLLDDLVKAARGLSGKILSLFPQGYSVIANDLVAEIKPLDGGIYSSSIDSTETWVTFRYCLNHSLFSTPFLLPAERNAFIIAYKLLGNRRYKLLRESQREAFGSGRNEQRQLELLREAGELRYPQPVEDFLDFLTDVETETSSISNGHKIRGKSPFARLADIIENSIQNANKTRYRPTALGGKEIVANVEKGLDIDLYNASSSIKQLAPLLLYLRYRARENDLLIIDEPEMNLHPESQAKLLEVLAMLVNHGVNVLLTTHSPYILAHLNNLAQANETSQAVKKRQAQSLYLKNPESLLRMEQVSAYEMRDNQLHSLKDPDYGIRWDTLSDISVELQQKYFEIYEEGHAKEKLKAARKTAKTAGGQTGAD